MSRQLAIIAIVLSVVNRCEGYDIIPRWGAASRYIPSPPSILISGGKTSTPDGTYSSSPNSPDLIRLPLSSNFQTSSPPYELLNISSSPSYAWHTLSLTSTSPVQAISFGGDGGPSTPLPAGTDSSWLFSMPDNGPTAFNQQTSSWATQPQRRILHSAVTGQDGMVYITGGQRNDGSGLILSDVYAFNANTSTFNPLPDLPRGTAHHVSAFLSNGTLVVLAGIYTSSSTGNPTLAETSMIYTLDTKSATPAWWESTAGGTAPPPRRGSKGVLMPNDKMYILGGTGMASADAMSDVWMMDMKAGLWSQITTTGNGPPARFDHTAIDIGGGQILVVGGYGAGSPVSPETYILDTNTNSWVGSFAATPPPSTLSVASAAPSSTPTQTNVNSNTADPSQLQSDSNTATQSEHSSTSASSSSPSSTESSTPPVIPAQLSKSAQIGLALGVTMGLGVLAALVVLMIRRRRAGYGAPGEDGDGGFGSSASAWFSPRPPPLEKDGQALLGDPRSGARPGEWSEKGGIIGLGLGAVGAGLSTLRSGKDGEGKYQQLEDERDVGGLVGGVARKSTRREGGGVRLIGPRSNPSPAQGGGGGSGVKSPPRLSILHDEDSRTFLGVPKAGQGDWKVDRNGKKEWRSASTVLGHDEEPTDPFEDIPLIRGGPVPTPTGLRSDHRHDPFDDHEEVDITTAVSRGPGLYQLPPLSASDPMDLAGLLAPGNRNSYANSSLPHSSHSRTSTYFSSSDAEEGTVHHAQFASQASALYSPQEEEYVPIKRNESFFRRMAAGGISTLISGGVGRRVSGWRGGGAGLDSSASQSKGIRDPISGPGPSLWPVESRDELENGVGEGSRHPPSTWNQTGHSKGPSLSSLASARSMRDMVVVQREGTDSSEASLVIIEQDESDMGSPVLDGMSPIEGQQQRGESFAQRLDRSFFASPTEEDLDFGLLNPISTSKTPTAAGAKASRYAPPIVNTSTSPRTASPASSSSTSTKPTIPPAGSPLPKHLVEHRRPVKDMVFSINKRASTVVGGGLTVADPMSPSSQYSVTPGATPMLGGSGEGRGVSWQVRRRESLVVANPDKKKLGGGA